MRKFWGYKDMKEAIKKIREDEVTNQYGLNREFAILALCVVIWYYAIPESEVAFINNAPLDDKIFPIVFSAFALLFLVESVINFARLKLKK